jgi:hypothetical protein
VAITYEVNSNSIVAGITAEWQTISTGSNGDGTQKLSSNWLRHIWRIPEMEMAEWLILLALRGASFTELKTTDEATPNSTGTYSTGRILTVTGQHRARQMLSVQVMFLVDITS